MAKGNHSKSGAEWQDDSYENSKYTKYRQERDSVREYDSPRRPRNVGAEDRQQQLDEAYIRKHGHQKETPSEFAHRSKAANIIKTKQFTVNEKPGHNEYTFGDKVLITNNNRYYNRNFKATPHPKKGPVSKGVVPEPDEPPQLNARDMVLVLTYLASDEPGREQLPKPISRQVLSQAELMVVYTYTGKNTINRVIHAYRANDKDSAVSKLTTIK